MGKYHIFFSLTKYKIWNIFPKIDWNILNLLLLLNLLFLLSFLLPVLSILDTFLCDTASGSAPFLFQKQVNWHGDSRKISGSHSHSCKTQMITTPRKTMSHNNIFHENNSRVIPNSFSPELGLQNASGLFNTPISRGREVREKKEFVMSSDWKKNDSFKFYRSRDF